MSHSGASTVNAGSFETRYPDQLHLQSTVRQAVPQGRDAAGRSDYRRVQSALLRTEPAVALRQLRSVIRRCHPQLPLTFSASRRRPCRHLFDPLAQHGLARRRIDDAHDPAAVCAQHPRGRSSSGGHGRCSGHACPALCVAERVSPIDARRRPLRWHSQLSRGVGVPFLPEPIDPVPTNGQSGRRRGLAVVFFAPTTEVAADNASVDDFPQHSIDR